MPDKYEIYAKGKWTRSIPSVTTNATFGIRYKADAKGGNENDTSYAAGVEGIMTLFYGVYDETRNKNGIVSAAIYPDQATADAALAQWETDKAAAATKAAEDVANGTDVNSGLVDITDPGTPQGDGLDVLPQTGVTGMLIYMSFSALLVCAGYALVKKA